jgi:peptide/nickel transport system substrate-binding protein
MVVTCNAFGSWSDSGYCNPAYDAMYQQQGAILDPAKRLQVLYKMQETIYNDRPYIVLTYDDVIEAHSQKWAGFVPSPVGSVNALSKQTLLSVHQTG